MKSFSFKSVFVSVIFLWVGLNSDTLIVKCETTESVPVPVSVKDVSSEIETHSEGSEEDLENWVAPEEMRKELVYYLSGYDEDDRPIWVAEWGKWNGRKYAEGGHEMISLYDKYVNQFEMRLMKSVSHRSTPDNHVSSFVLIIDMDGYSLDQLTSAGSLIYNIKKLISWTSLTETLGKGFIINTNFLAQRAVNMAKPILGRNFEKFEVFGTNKAKWLPVLLRELPQSQLPKWYGGNQNFTPVQIYG